LITNSFCPTLINQVIQLWSTKTILPTVVNTSLQTRTISYTMTGKRQVRSISEDQMASPF